MSRLFLKIRDPLILIGDHDSEAACFLHGNRHNRYRNIGFVCLMEIEHYLVIHLVDMITREYEHILGIEALHIFDILIYGICRTGVPFAVLTLFIGRKNTHTADITVKIPRNTDAYV